jgi:hypothetical protein
MGSPSPSIFPILPFPLSATSPPNKSRPSSGPLLVLSLCHNQLPIASINSANNVPSVSSTNHIPSVKQHKLAKQCRNQSTTTTLLQIHEPPQQTDTFPTHGAILTITGGSNIDFNNKRQRRDYYRQVNHVIVKGPITQTKWFHIPITFSAQDINLASFPHTDAMVITIHTDRWGITKILIDNGSQAEILFLAALEKMGYDRKQLKEPTKPHNGFNGQRIERVKVITLPISFGTPKKSYTKYVTFDVVDMLYLYNTIFGRGLLNTFKAALHSGYLCLKIPPTFIVISIFGSQKDARNI